MSKDSILKDNLQVLDNILLFLIDKREYKTEINTLVNSIYNLQLNLIKPDKPESSITLGDIVKRSDVEDKLLYKVEKSLLYLEELGLLKSTDNYYVSLTYQGIIRCSEGFVKTYCLKESNDQRLLNVETLQNFHLKWMTILTGLIAFGTVVASVYYIFDLFSVRFCLCSK
ncbi:hypothetical protein ACKUCE_11845 [Flavobacterium psychrophilum]|uniref:hypothetical protein n=1 Tax=Flavobacterium psychrophilum TaxID=96345 RepID=UPI0004E7E94C|nr:hypothetical protein [Flavobacterium psychrophilum]AIJ37099.1 hypothetical protein FPSM_00604 [Flavobacterium psychrophilum]AIN72764.1 hypothetical protein FPG101_02880 [Flavobacterium psychrophilum FPG101]EKT3975137.1 hypothetical protein [Flavobacterium psychrophilum]EKT4527413.1 hypothetical protein [Flavobacterium psychrophilum]EKT4535367.1 hypothetical protein [Flavobacterium psychrophilum]